MLTLKQFSDIIPTNREPKPWFDASQELFAKYQINTVNRIAGFMAQCAHESNDFRTLEENLNYSVDALNRVFPRYFGPGKRNAVDYARNPQKLANYVYMDEFRSKSGALGNTQPGDGWRFRGRGIKQLTGRNNYAAFGRTVGMTAEQAADYIATPKGAFESACWFWSTRRLNAVADTDDIVRMTQIINGGDIGLTDRRNRYNRAKAILNSTTSQPRPVTNQITDSVTQTPTTNTVLKRGSTGNMVREIQRALKLAADGVFGMQTEVAVRSWQRINRFTVNGILDTNQIQEILKLVK
jgi:putative chitinase